MTALLAEKWSLHGPLTMEDYKLLNEAVKVFNSIHYQPISVSKELGGANYHFKCTTSIPPSEVSWLAIVEVYAPLKGTPYITGITRI